MPAHASQRRSTKCPSFLQVTRGHSQQVAAASGVSPCTLPRQHYRRTPGAAALQKLENCTPVTESTHPAPSAEQNATDSARTQRACGSTQGLQSSRYCNMSNPHRQTTSRPSPGRALDTTFSWRLSGCTLISHPRLLPSLSVNVLSCTQGTDTRPRERTGDK